MYTEIRLGLSQVESHPVAFLSELCGIVVEGLIMKVMVHGSSPVVRK